LFADIHVPGMLEAYVVRSPYAQARIQSIDSQAVMAAREVIAVFTAHDLPSDLPPITYAAHSARELEDALQMPWQVILYVYAGEPVAVIVSAFAFMQQRMHLKTYRLGTFFYERGTGIFWLVIGFLVNRPKKGQTCGFPGGAAPTHFSHPFPLFLAI